MFSVVFGLLHMNAARQLRLGVSLQVDREDDDDDDDAQKCTPDFFFIIEANTMNPDQTAPMGAVWSGSIVFAKSATKVHQQMRE